MGWGRGNDKADHDNVIFIRQRRFMQIGRERVVLAVLQASYSTGLTCAFAVCPFRMGPGETVTALG